MCWCAQQNAYRVHITHWIYTNVQTGRKCIECSNLISSFIMTYVFICIMEFYPLDHISFQYEHDDWIGEFILSLSLARISTWIAVFPLQNFSWSTNLKTPVLQTSGSILNTQFTLITCILLAFHFLGLDQQRIFFLLLP